ncbi:MAG: DUF512 domain-containing protein, partial [candidate division Zixibacteria bacterium]|nr:DUF512 domain-containing protein [candidate division Zixibacteria bacterium]
HQIENGVGMVRKFLDDFKNKAGLLPSSLENKQSVTLVSGELASGFIVTQILDRLNKIKNLQVDLVTVKNDFLGESVTVSGLLSGSDIMRALKNKKTGKFIILPHNCLNADGFFLDGLRLNDLGKKSGVKIIQGSYDLVDTLLSILPEKK